MFNFYVGGYVNIVCLLVDYWNEIPKGFFLFLSTMCSYTIVSDNLEDLLYMLVEGEYDIG